MREKERRVSAVLAGLLPITGGSGNSRTGYRTITHSSLARIRVYEWASGYRVKIGPPLPVESWNKTESFAVVGRGF